MIYDKSEVHSAYYWLVGSIKFKVCMIKDRPNRYLITDGIRYYKIETAGCAIIIKDYSILK